MWKLRKSTTTRNNVVYAPLQQTFSDDEDFEDEILFDRDPKITANPRSSGSTSKRSSTDVIELQNLNGSPLQFHRRRSEVAVRSGWSITQKICLFISVIGILGAGAGAALFFPRYLFPTNSEWNVDFANYESDSCVRLVDIDGDGRLDILLGLTPYPGPFSVFSDQNSEHSEQNFKKFCKQKGDSCGGELVALRGYDGKQLWRLSTKSSILYIHCDQLDVDQDGQFDCLVTGYHATLHAVDPRKGILLWTAEAKHLSHQWNIYQALVVPDVDKDNVDDVLVLHGGYPHYEQIQVSARENGCFLLFSGATGHSLGKSVNLTSTVNFTSTEKGTYMSPVIYKPSQNYSLNILLGSGQLATSGSLWLIPWEVLHAQLMDMEVKFPLKKSLPALDKKRNKQIYRSSNKGLIVPPVIVDVNNDKIMDILMSTFDGKVILYDGLTLQKKWEKDFEKYESFSIPAPGYFDDDQHLDFMMHWYYGTWPTYGHSMVVILSGKDGKILWKTVSSLSSLTSDLSLQTVDVHRDAFVFKVLGRKGSVSVDHKGVIHTDRKHAESTDQIAENPRKRDHVSLVRNSDLECNSSRISVLTEEIFLMDRSNMAKPILLSQQIAQKFFYADSSVTNRSHDPKGKGSLCAILRPVGKGTGAIGDLDGDGQPDYVSLTNMEAMLHNRSIIKNTTLQKRNIVSAIDSNLSVPLSVFSPSSNDSTTKNGGPAKTLKSTHFAPQGQQVWTEYLGSQQNSVYRRHLSDGGNTVSKRSTVLYYLVVIFTLLVVLL